MRRWHLEASTHVMLHWAVLAMVVVWALPRAWGQPVNAVAAQPLSLEDALDASRKHNPMLRSHDAGIEAAKLTRVAQKADYLPIIKVEGNGILWDTDLELALGSGGSAAALPPPSTPYESALAGLLQGLSTPSTLREQFTAEVGVSIIQPLTALMTLSEGYELFDLGVATHKLRRNEAARSIALATAKAYFRLLQAHALRDNAEQAVLQMQAQLDRVKRLVDGGVAGENDRLKLKVAVAAAHQQVLSAKMTVAMAESALATTMGQRADTPVTPVLPPETVIEAVAFNQEQMCSAAIKNRPEVQMATHGIRQAEIAYAMERAKLVPSVNVIANYRHTEGSSLAATDSAFIGVFVEWQAFRWHATTSKIDAAAARTDKVRHQLEALKAGICLAVRQTALRHETAVKALDVADTAKAQAIEAVRLETRRFEAGAATSTDVVVAEAALSIARGNRSAAYYEAFVAHAEFRSATGAPLTAQAFLAGD